MLLPVHIIVPYIKENIITKLQKLYSTPRNPGAGSKSPTLFVKKPLCTGDLSPTHKIFIERPATNSSLLILLENLALIPPFATLPFITLCISKDSGLTRLSKPRPSSFLQILCKEFNTISDPTWRDSLALKN